jgi:hypothetical protein
MKSVLTLFGRPIFLVLVLLYSQIATTSAKDRVSEEFHQSYPLAANGELKLDNVNGRVHITTWDRAEIKVEAIKRADNQTDLDSLKIEISSKPSRVRIHTIYPKWKSSEWRKSNSASVDYEITVPAQASLDNIEAVNGDVDIEGVRGNVNASTVNGRLKVNGLSSDSRLESVNGVVEAVFEKFDGVKTVALKSVNGKLELSLPANVSAEVSAKTLNGSIHADSELTLTKKWPVGSTLHGTFGNGGSKIKLETVNGPIRVHRSGVASSSNEDAPGAAPVA